MWLTDMAHRITRESLRAAGACYPLAKLEALVPPEGLTPAQVASMVGAPVQDLHWALRCAAGATNQQLRLHAVWCARQALALVPSPDPRSVAACDVAERYAMGDASVEDLRSARSAADAADAAADAADAAADAAREVFWRSAVANLAEHLS